MQLEVGKVLEGKVTGITKFGAFVELQPGVVGMVHISEISNTYVNDIAEVLKREDLVKVKVLSVGNDNKIGLSIKRAMAPSPDAAQRPPRRPQNNNGQSGGKDFGARPQGGQRPPSAPRNNGGSAPTRPSGTEYGGAPSSLPKGPAAFEDMLSKFMATSDEKISGMKKEHAVNRRAGSRRK